VNEGFIEIEDECLLVPVLLAFGQVQFSVLDVAVGRQLLIFEELEYFYGAYQVFSGDGVPIADCTNNFGDIVDVVLAWGIRVRLKAVTVLRFGDALH